MVCEAYSNTASAFELEMSRMQNLAKCEMNSKSLYATYESAMTVYLNIRDVGADILFKTGQVVDENNLNRILFNTMIASMIEKALPMELRLIMKRHSEYPMQPTDLNRVFMTLKEQSRVYESIKPTHSTNTVKENSKPKPTHHRAFATSVNTERVAFIKCLLCRLDNQNKSEHVIWECQKFKAMSDEEKKRFFFRNKFCINCGLHPYSKEKPCRKENQCAKKGCTAKHNSIFHTEGRKDFENKNTSQNHKNTFAKTNGQGWKKPQRYMAKYSQANETSQYRIKISRNDELPSLSPSVTINVASHSGNEGGFCQAILDTGASANFISQTLVDKLKLKTIRTSAVAEAIDGTEIKIDRKVYFKI